jgi:hypothetical protein
MPHVPFLFEILTFTQVDLKPLISPIVRILNRFNSDVTLRSTLFPVTDSETILKQTEKKYQVLFLSSMNCCGALANLIYLHASYGAARLSNTPLEVEPQ